MKKLVSVTAAVAMTVTILQAQETFRATRPAVPASEVLDRLNLKVSWRLYLPMEGLRDGIDVVQLIGAQIFIQTRSGLLIALDGEKGELLWQQRFGQPFFKDKLLLGHNELSVFAVSGTRLYNFDRRTGQLYWEFDMGNLALAPPKADGAQVYVYLVGDKLATFYLFIDTDKGRELLTFANAPKREPPQSPTPPIKETRPGKSDMLGPLHREMKGGRSEPIHSISQMVRPTHAAKAMLVPFELKMLWDHTADPTRERAPIMSPTNPENPGYQPKPFNPGAKNLAMSPTRQMKDEVNPGHIVATGMEGSMTATTKNPKSMRWNISPDKPDAVVSAPIGQHGHIAYVPLENGRLFAVNMDTGDLLWKDPFVSEAPIYRKPEVTNEDIYVCPTREGMYRVNRLTGERMWRSREADQFLSHSQRFVYAADKDGRLLVLDRTRGTVLTSFDARDFTVRVANELTDRIYLGAHDGLFVCIHDKELTTPLTNKRIYEEKIDYGKEKKGAPKPADKGKEMMPKKAMEK